MKEMVLWREGLNFTLDNLPAIISQLARVDFAYSPWLTSRKLFKIHIPFLKAKANLAPVGDAHENKPEPKKTPAKTDNQNAEVEPQTMHNIRIRQQYLQ